MESKKIVLRFGVITLLILLAAISRMVPHINNFSPLGAIGLFGAAHFSKKWQALIIPLMATFLSDLYLNNVVYKACCFPTFTWFSWGLYWPFSSLMVYGASLITIIIGFRLFKKVTMPTVLSGVLISTVIFFVLSNFASWPNNPLYPQNFTGLMECFAAGIPFLKATLLGNLIYSIILFGSYALLQKNVPALKSTYQIA